MVRTRFAPSPTGYLHIGGVRTALFNWLFARKHGGQFILRIDDTDEQRNVKEALAPILHGFRWLGLDWDEGPDIGGPNAPYVQTQRLQSYEGALEKLKVVERVYPCTCSRSDVEAAASAPHLGQEGPVYPGTCAKRSVSDAATLTRSVSEGSTSPFAWRFRTTNNTRQFTDLVAGPQQCNVAQELGDFIIAKADGSPSYQLAVVADDHAMGITEVLRGDDLLPSAFRQLELYDVLGWQPPQFAHVPLVVGSDGRRLAKRHGDTRLATLRGAGVPPERLIGLLAWSCGLIEKPQPAKAHDLLSGFNLGKLSRKKWTFTPENLHRLLSPA